MFAYPCILHVENVDQEYVAVEEEAAAEDQEGQQPQELEAVEPVEEQEFDLANPDQQPGKHRFIYPESYMSYVWCKHRFIYPESYMSLRLVQAPEALTQCLT